jgi:2-dehydro-3-deoxygluconokinase
MPHIISFGETMLRLSPPPGVRLDEATTFNVFVGGTESNTLTALARLGCHTTWLSGLPANPAGRRVASELRRHGIDTSRVVWAGGRLGIFYADEAPAPLGPQVHYDRAGSACALIDPAALDLAGLEDADLLHLTGITPALGGGAPAAFERLLTWAAAQGVALSFDVNYRAKLWSPAEAAAGMAGACRQARIVICSRSDAATIWGLHGTAEQVLRGLADRFGLADKTLVLTLGNEGAAELRDGEYAEAPTFPAMGTVRFGSGDAFAAGYLYCYLGGEHFLTARERLGANGLLFGNAMAALKRCIEGDMAIITPDEVLALLAGGKEAGFR